MISGCSRRARKAADGGAVPAVFGDREVVPFDPGGEEAEAVGRGHRRDRHAPVGPAPGRPRRRRRCATAPRRHSPAAGGPRAGGRSAPACRCPRLRLTRTQSGSSRAAATASATVAALEARVAGAEDDPLHPVVARQEPDSRRAGTGGCRCRSPGRAGGRPRRRTRPARRRSGPPCEPTQSVLTRQPLLVQAARAASRARRSASRSRRGRPGSMPRPSGMTVDGLAGLEVLLLPGDDHEPVGPAEGRDRARALAHRVGGQAVAGCATRLTSRYSVRPRSLLTRTGIRAVRVSRRLGRGPPRCRITGATNSWNVKIAEVGKPGRIATGRRRHAHPGRSACRASARRRARRCPARRRASTR